MSAEERELRRADLKLSHRRLLRKQFSTETSLVSSPLPSPKPAPPSRLSGSFRSLTMRRMAGSFVRRLRAKEPETTPLKERKKIRAHISRLWRVCVVGNYLNAGTWTLEDYMNYHLSLYCFLEPLDNPGSTAEIARAEMTDVAWASALEDWAGDTRGLPRSKLDFSTFFDSVFELTECYATAPTLPAYCDFLIALFEGTTISYDELMQLEGRQPRQPRRRSWAPSGLRSPSSRTPRMPSAAGRWRQVYPLEKDADAVAKAADDVRSAVCSMAGSSKDDLAKWLQVHGARSWTRGGGSANARDPTIDTPADLMAALLQAADEARDAARPATEKLLRSTLRWISPSEGHELVDDACRGRVVSLMRRLDSGERMADGRLSAADLLARGDAVAPSSVAALQKQPSVLQGMLGSIRKSMGMGRRMSI
jgi:hypothetical protein